MTQKTTVGAKNPNFEFGAKIKCKVVHPWTNTKVAHPWTKCTPRRSRSWTKPIDRTMTYAAHARCDARGVASLCVCLVHRAPSPPRKPIEAAPRDCLYARALCRNRGCQEFFETGATLVLCRMNGGDDSGSACQSDESDPVRSAEMVRRPSDASSSAPSRKRPREVTSSSSGDRDSRVALFD